MPKGVLPKSDRFGNSDNLPYEKRGKEVHCIADEVPFEIPDSWEWARLGSVTYNHGQKIPDSQFCYIDIGSIDNVHQRLNAKETVLQATEAPSRARRIIVKGDVLYSTVRPYLHNMCIVDKDFTYPPIASTGFAVFTCHTDYSMHFYFIISFLLILIDMLMTQRIPKELHIQQLMMNAYLMHLFQFPLCKSNKESLP